MLFCDSCGEEILGSPYRRRRHDYCSRSCADAHEFELNESGTDDDLLGGFGDREDIFD